MKLWVTQQTAQARYDICKACDKFTPETSKCSECGCYLKIKVKAATVECPLNKWPVESENTVVE
jgi:hypothetical protein